MEVDRFMDKISTEPNTGCWLWTLALSASGYGVWRWKNERRAHRISYRLFVGSIPEGMVIDHRCRVRSCVNPRHLQVVTPAENLFMAGSLALAKQAKEQTHCKSGHEFTLENTGYQWSGRRECRACQKQYNREYARRWRAKQRAARGLL